MGCSFLKCNYRSFQLHLPLSYIRVQPLLLATSDKWPTLPIVATHLATVKTLKGIKQNSYVAKTRKTTWSWLHQMYS